MEQMMHISARRRRKGKECGIPGPVRCRGRSTCRGGVRAEGRRLAAGEMRGLAERLGDLGTAAAASAAMLCPGDSPASLRGTCGVSSLPQPPPQSLATAKHRPVCRSLSNEVLRAGRSVLGMFEAVGDLECGLTCSLHR